MSDSVDEWVKIIILSIGGIGLIVGAIYGLIQIVIAGARRVVPDAAALFQEFKKLRNDLRTEMATAATARDVIGAKVEAIDVKQDLQVGLMDEIKVNTNHKFDMLLETKDAATAVAVGAAEARGALRGAAAVVAGAGGAPGPLDAPAPGPIEVIVTNEKDAPVPTTPVKG